MNRCFSVLPVALITASNPVVLLTSAGVILPVGARETAAAIAVLLLPSPADQQFVGFFTKPASIVPDLSDRPGIPRRTLGSGTR